MQDGTPYRSYLGIYLGIFIVFSIGASCKDRGEGPKSPEGLSTLNEGPLLPSTADGNPQKPGTTEPNSNKPAGSNTLPEKFVNGLGDCQKQNRYYDLQVASCTATPLADFPCDLTILLSEQSAILNAGQKVLLKDYVDKNLQGFSLYACTLEDLKPALHFYKVEADKIRAHNVKIAGGT